MENEGPQPVVFEGLEVISILEKDKGGYNVCRMSDNSIQNVPVEYFDPDSFTL